jgi:hypothetical protein
MLINYNKLYFSRVLNKCILYNVLTFHSYFFFYIFIYLAYHIMWFQYTLSTFLLLSPGRYLCSWTIGSCGYHPPTSQCRSYIYYLLKFITCLFVNTTTLYLREYDTVARADNYFAEYRMLFSRRHSNERHIFRGSCIDVIKSRLRKNLKAPASSR